MSLYDDNQRRLREREIEQERIHRWAQTEIAENTRIHEKTQRQVKSLMDAAGSDSSSKSGSSDISSPSSSTKSYYASSGTTPSGGTVRYTHETDNFLIRTGRLIKNFISCVIAFSMVGVVVKSILLKDEPEGSASTPVARQQQIKASEQPTLLATRLNPNDKNFVVIRDTHLLSRTNPGKPKFTISKGSCVIRLEGESPAGTRMPVNASMYQQGIISGEIPISHLGSYKDLMDNNRCTAFNNSDVWPSVKAEEPSKPAERKLYYYEVVSERLPIHFEASADSKSTVSLTKDSCIISDQDPSVQKAFLSMIFTTSGTNLMGGHVEKRHLRPIQADYPPCKAVLAP